jgi:type II secretory pathway predicted ATPase ExeA
MLDHWQLRFNPFAANADDGEFALAGRSEEALSRVAFLIEQQRRLGVVTGPAGVGKSRLLRETMRLAARTHPSTILVDVTGLSRDEFAARLAAATGAALGFHVSWDAIEDALWGWRVTGAATLWVIDQADHAAEPLDLALLRLIRLLDRVCAAGTVLIAARIRPKRNPLADEVDLTIALEPWSVADCGEFLRRRLQSAGARRPIITADGLDALAEAAGGRPGLLIRLCDLALHAGWTLGATEIDDALVAGLAEELALDGVAKPTGCTPWA